MLLSELLENDAISNEELAILKSISQMFAEKRQNVEKPIKDKPVKGHLKGMPNLKKHIAARK